VSEIPEGAVLSKRWINPFELGSRGPVVRELYEELEPFPTRMPSSAPPPKSERRVSLRPSRRDQDPDLPSVFSMAPPASIPRPSTESVVSQAPRARPAVSQRPELGPSSVPSQGATIRSRAHSVQPRAVKADPTPPPASTKAGRSSKRASAASQQLSQRPRSSFRPQAEVTILELDAFDTPDPPPVSLRPSKDLGAQQAVTQRPGSKAAGSPRRSRSPRAEPALANSPKPPVKARARKPETTPQVASVEPPAPSKKSRRTRAKAQEPSLPPAPERVAETTVPKARARRSRVRN
jgi:hypothetical protein